MEVEVEEQQQEKEALEYIDILLGNLEQLRPFSAEDDAFKHISLNDAYMLYKVVADEFGENFRESVLRSDNVEHLMHFADLLEVYWTADLNSDGPKMIPEDQIIWTIAKYIATLSSPVVYGKLGGLYQDCIIRLTKQMKKPLKLFVQKQIVYALRDLLDEKYTLTLQINEENAAVSIATSLGDINLEAVTFTVHELSGSVSIIQNVALSILQHGTLDDTVVGDDEVLIIMWMCLLRLIVESEPRLKNKAILITQRLLSMDLCNAMFADLLFDALMVTEQWVYDLDKEYVGSEELHVKEALETCERTFGDAFRKADERETFCKTELNDAIRWAKQAAKLCASRPSPEVRLVNVLIDLCSALSQLDEGIGKDRCDFTDDIYVTVRKILECELQIRIEDIGDLFTFIVTIMEHNTNSSGLCEELSKQLSASRERYFGSEVTKYLRMREMIILALKEIPDIEKGNVIIAQLIPENSEVVEIIENVGKIVTGGELILSALISLVSTFIERIDAEAEFWLAVLSLPWLNLAQFNTEVDRFHFALPALSKMHHLSHHCLRFFTWNVRADTIPALAHLNACSEWRLKIYSSALTSQETVLQRIAIEHFPSFICSAERVSFDFLLGHVLYHGMRAIQANDSTELSSVVFKAVTRSICCLSTGKRLTTKNDICPICRRDEQPNRNMVIKLDKIFELLKKAVFHSDTASKWGCCELLTSVLYHVSYNTLKKYEAEFPHLLILMKETDEDFCSEFQWCLKPMLEMKFDSIQSGVQRIISDLQKLPSGFHNFKLYAICCLLNTDNESLALMCLNSLLNVAIVQEYAFIVADIKQAVEDRMEKYASGLHAWQWFLRKKKCLLEGLTKRIIYEHCEGLRPMNRGDFSQLDHARFGKSVEYAIGIIIDIFNFPKNDIESFMQDACPEIVTTLLLYCLTEKQKIQVALDTICRLRQMDPELLMAESLPLLLVKHLLNDLSTDVMQSALTFINDYTKGVCTWSSLVSKKAYECTVGLLQHLCVNEEKAMMHIKNFHKLIYGRKSAFIFTSFVRESYLGILLHFRQAVSDDRFYDERLVLVSSLCKVMAMIKADGTDFLDTTADKMLIVLRAFTHLGVVATKPWKVYLETLSDKVLVRLLPHTLVSIVPLLHCREGQELLKYIFVERQLHFAKNGDFERIALVFWDNPKIAINEYLSPNLRKKPLEQVFRACASLLKENYEEVCEVVLHKLLRVLSVCGLLEDDCFDSFAAELVPSLLKIIRKSSLVECRRLASLALGRLGALDPGRIGSSLALDKNGDHRYAGSVFVDSGEQFYIELLEQAAIAYSGILDASMQVECSYSIQTVLRELLGKKGTESSNLWDLLSEQCKDSLSILRTSSFILYKPVRQLPSKRPLVDCDEAKDFRRWINLWYKIAAERVRDGKLKILFSALEGVVNADIVFSSFILPQLILQSIIEHNVACMNEAAIEMIAVLQRAIVDSGWPRSAAHLVFAILDCLERFVYYRKSRKIPADVVLNRTLEILASVTNQTLPNGNYLVVAAAEICHCSTRALKWCEQYAIGTSEQGETLFRQNHFGFLEKIYVDLGDVDGVAGAFETIRACSEPTINDRILSLEADGNYWGALPLYGQLTKVTPSYLKCLLRLNEPRLALSEISRCLENSLEDSDFLEELRSCQIEATWRLQQWDSLTKLVNDKPKLTTCGSTYASAICSLKNRHFGLMGDSLAKARARLVDALAAMAIEDSDTYTQAYKNITQLHILAEIEDAKTLLKLQNGEQLSAEDLTKVMNIWQRRATKAVQCTSVLEPILNTRRSLLNLLSGDIGRGPICDLFLQSCRLARHDGHLQVAWSYLSQAKAMNVNQFEVEMEEARYLYQKGNQVQAIQILSNLLKRRFASKLEQLKSISGAIKKFNGSEQCSAELKRTLEQEPKEEKENFIKVQLLLAEYSLRAGASSFGDLYNTYYSLPLIAEPSEDLYYRVAVFLDNYLYNKNENAPVDKILMILKAYKRVLLQGRNYLFHVMPRMLSIWLDYTQKMAENGCTQPPAKMQHRGVSHRSTVNEDKDVREMNAVICDAFKRLDYYMFYTAFAQLISRITHPNDEVFQTLKMILSKLLVEYPHQCLWQSIAVFRCDADKQPLRFTRCRAVYDLAKRTDENGQLKNLITQYEYVAAAFIRVAEDSCPIGTQSPFSQRYAYVSEYFRSGVMNSTIWTTERANGRGQPEAVQPSIVVPMREMIEHAAPSSVLNTLSQFPGPKSELQFSSNTFGAVYIHSVEEEFTVMKSLVRPKKITIIGSDGKKYPLMCKAKDELRKDGRLMDINRMVNALLHQNADARRRQLYVRTYSVIPLQDAGGLIEWVPNLNTYRNVLEPLMREKCSNVMSDKEWFDRWIPNATDEEKLERLRLEYYPRHPIVMPDWFRRSFPDSCRWYAARLAFTHTSAVMSVIGFILGLGDRHGENVLIDVISGDAIHVDFNLLFNKGENLNVPEVVPFRLTRNIVAGFGATGVEGAFRRSCETTMRVLREHDEALHTVLQTFVHDPLLEWMHAESRAQQYKQRQGNGAKLSPPAAQQQAQEAIDLIRLRLLGHIITPKIYRTATNNPPMSVEGQVGKLIDIARDEMNLARMYIGWCPFL